jgi:hypothetical protein
MTQAKISRPQILLIVLLAAAVLAALLLVTQSAAANERVDNNGQVPFYARFGQNEIFDDGETAVIVFYRPPSCIPADFNMMAFFHFPGPTGPGAFACNPPTTDGFEIWEGAPGEGPAPKQAKLTGNGAVPVWFFAWSDLEPLVNSGVVTIGDLEALSPLRGSATIYDETLHPSQSNANSLVKITAKGNLEGGGSFRVNISYRNGVGNTIIDLDQ